MMWVLNCFERNVYLFQHAVTCSYMLTQTLRGTIFWSEPLLYKHDQRNFSVILVKAHEPFFSGKLFTWICGTQLVKPFDCMLVEQCICACTILILWYTRKQLLFSNRYPLIFLISSRILWRRNNSVFYSSEVVCFCGFGYGCSKLITPTAAAIIFCL